MSEENREKRVAVLIDAENVASKYIDIVLNEANNLGNIIIKRIYGDWTSQQMGSWRNIILDNSVQPIQQYSNVSGKNASDSALIIDAMDLLYTGPLDCFCIVSSDSDFTRLAARLRESEKYVLGMGEQKTPKSFISACNKFSYIDILYKASLKEQRPAKDEKPDTAEKSAPSGVRLKTVRKALIAIAEENSDDDGWISSSLLGNLLSKQFPDFDVRNFQYKKFVQFIASLQLFESRRQSLNVYFRLKQ
ncbi:OST-HTH/LOTUS domain-containing protein [Fusobacterium naviforme]|uniref:Uncharacterized LabA/DUF88 family protein n=1 Tax=Moryella indoligenes TaxID=371674 RepID=A0AAE3VB56_9FIRM|nr:NYN domain-containing protein [Moryella indoligenes]KAB0578528.1 NYN domain-containing protein [Fusobacterium naviforme]MDQ0153013.1 uncharacterized LabA/DUF88 family protein [Moryella indoligenes]PSL11267.1 OST-HTH/LOTUS domain-containing protein [Fusobacterium naviforme]STO28642.1 NYN domain [Fusobacterium naviforme]